MQRNATIKAKATAPVTRFGGVPLAAAEITFRNALNREMMDFLRSLPESVHTDAVILLMEHFGTPFFPAFNYFQNYFAPSWSILYWLEQVASEGRPKTHLPPHAPRAHAMALFLHPLDDHLNDGQLPTTHLSLLLRSQAWWRMNTALERLTVDVPQGSEIVADLTNAYYASIGASPAVATLDGYCAHFRKQMATWMIVPALLARRITPDESFGLDLQTAYGAFGTAWRLMDDLQDKEVDLAAGGHSAVYYLLPQAVRGLWDQGPDGRSPARVQKIRKAIRQRGIVEALQKRILRELAIAATRLDAIQLGGLARELRCMGAPLADGRTAS
jgi:hypothetical protein